MAAQFSDNDSIESDITYDEVERDQSVTDSYDPLQYLISVRNTFGGKAEEYRHLLALLSDFHAKRTTIPVVKSRIKLLFFEHQELIEGFNTFLPRGSEIALPLTRRADIHLQETINYVNKVKVAFSQEVERYASFLQLITGYQEGGMSLKELSEQMCELLSDRQDLLEEFFDSMPSRRETFQHVALNRATTMEASQQQ